MKIVVLDGFALNPGDLSWAAIAALGDLTVHERTPSAQTRKRAAGAEILLTNKTVLDAEMLASLPALRYVGVLATGYNVVDVAAARAQGIVVTNVPAYGTQSVAQMVFALLFELGRGVRVHSEAVRAGAWSESLDFCFWKTPQIELADKTMGIIGFGRIGRCVARIAAAFGMNVITADAAPTAPPAGLERFAWVGIPELLAAADVVSLHCPLTPETAGLIDAGALAAMKRSAFLINTARGPLVVERDLAAALNDGVIAGAGLDVLGAEPPAPDNPLLTARHCVITPHIAWATLEARTRLLETAIANLRAYLAGRPVNTVGA